MLVWQSPSRVRALAQAAAEPARRRIPTRFIAAVMGVWFNRRRRMHAFGYVGHLPYAIPAMALSAMLV